MDTAADSERTSTTGGAADAAADGSSAAATPGVAPAVASPRPAPPAAGLVFDDPFDRPSSDDTDRGWGDLPAGSVDDDFSRFLNEKPPHHL